MKKLLFSVTKKDLTLEYFSGTGGGGQHRNKHQNCCRCKHPESKAVGICQEHKSKVQNTKVAFRRMAESKAFLKWIRIEASRKTGEYEEIRKKIDKELREVKTEIKDENGSWIPSDLNEKSTLT